MLVTTNFNRPQSLMTFKAKEKEVKEEKEVKQLTPEEQKDLEKAQELYAIIYGFKNAKDGRKTGSCTPEERDFLKEQIKKNGIYTVGQFPKEPDGKVAKYLDIGALPEHRKPKQ